MHVLYIHIFWIQTYKKKETMATFKTPHQVLLLKGENERLPRVGGHGRGFLSHLGLECPVCIDRG